MAVNNSEFCGKVLEEGDSCVSRVSLESDSELEEFVKLEVEFDQVQSTYSTHLDRMSNALEHGTFSDVSFLLGSKGEEVRGHKAIICIGGSPIFQALLTGKSFDGSPISIPDVQPSGFKPLLKYFYLGKVPEIPEEDYIEFLRAVKYFKVEELYKICREHILNEITLKVGNVIDVYENCKVLEEKELEEAADHFIKKKAESILAQTKFSELPAQDLLHFISSDDFSAPEVPICRAVHKWGEAECVRQNLEKSPENLRLVLKEIIPQIRFPMMNSGDFAVEIAILNLLTLEETVAVHNYFFARHHKRHQIPKGGRFISKPRKYVNYEDEDGVDNIVWSLEGGINTGLRTETVYIISNKVMSSANPKSNYLNALPLVPMYGGIIRIKLATKDIAKYEFKGEYYLTTFWGIHRGSRPNTYTLFSKYRNEYLTRDDDNYAYINGPEDKMLTEAENLTFEPAKNSPGYFVLTSGIKNSNDKPLVLALSEEAYGNGLYPKFIEKPEEIDSNSILWTFQKIKI